MARREMNKGWKIFGIIILGLLFVAAAFCAVVGIAAAVNNVGFVDQLKMWFTPEKAEEAEAVVEAVKHIFRK